MEFHWVKWIDFELDFEVFASAVIRRTLILPEMESVNVCVLPY